MPTLAPKPSLNRPFQSQPNLREKLPAVPVNMPNKSPIAKSPIEAIKPMNKENVDTSKHDSMTEVKQNFEKEYKPKFEEVRGQTEFYYNQIIAVIKQNIESSNATNNLAVIQDLNEFQAARGLYKGEVIDPGVEGPLPKTQALLYTNNIIQELNKDPQSLTNLASLNYVVNDGVELLNTVNRQILTLDCIIAGLRAKGVKCDTALLDSYRLYQDHLNKMVTLNQKAIAYFQEPYSNYVRGYFGFVDKPTDYIEANFKIIPEYRVGKIVAANEEYKDVKNTGLRAEEKCNQMMSMVEDVALVIEGPQFSKLDANTKVDSMVFIDNGEVKMPLEVKNNLTKLLYRLSYATYRKSHLEDYGSEVIEKPEEKEVFEQNLLKASTKLELCNTGMDAYKEEVTKLQIQIDELQAKANTLNIEIKKELELIAKKNKKGFGAGLSIEAIKYKDKMDKKLSNIQEQVESLNTEQQSFTSFLYDKSKEQAILQQSFNDLYKTYNPQGIATPLALNPEGAINIYRAGQKFSDPYRMENPMEAVPNPEEMADIKEQINLILLRHNITVRPVQIKNNNYSKSVQEALDSHKITGAISPNTKYTSTPRSSKQAIKMAFNINNPQELKA
jgi:hypothetical protein